MSREFLSVPVGLDSSAARPLAKEEFPMRSRDTLSRKELISTLIAQVCIAGGLIGLAIIAVNNFL